MVNAAQGINKTKRIVLNDLWVYKPSEDSLKQITAKRWPDLRYGHWACMAGEYLVIYGGMNETGTVLSDVWIYSFYESRWIKVIMTSHAKTTETPPGICFSRMVSIFYKGRKNNPEKDFFGKYVMNQNIDPFLPKHIREKEKDKDCVIEGCYMFGGITAENELINDLYVFKGWSGGMKFEWEKVNEYNGKPPWERFHHYMEYWDFNNSIVIHGGRNDNKVTNSILNDLYYLQVDTLTWIEVKYSFGKISTPRFSHAVSIMDSKIIIFGGVGKDYTMQKTLEIIELDPEKFQTK